MVLHKAIPTNSNTELSNLNAPDFYFLPPASTDINSQLYEQLKTEHVAYSPMLSRKDNNGIENVELTTPLHNWC